MKLYKNDTVWVVLATGLSGEINQIVPCLSNHLGTL